MIQKLTKAFKCIMWVSTMLAVIAIVASGIYWYSNKEKQPETIVNAPSATVSPALPPPPPVKTALSPAPMQQFKTPSALDVLNQRRQVEPAEEPEAEKRSQSTESLLKSTELKTTASKTASAAKYFAPKPKVERLPTLAAEPAPTQESSIPSWAIIPAPITNPALMQESLTPGWSTIPSQKPPIPSEIDQILENMPWGNIVFNTPSKMKLDDSLIIQLILDRSESIEKLSKYIQTEGKIEGAHIRISNLMEAHLSSTSFQISPITPERQAVSSKEKTEWKWEIRPTSTGLHYLHLTLTAFFDFKGSEAPRPIRTFDKTIEVEVSGWQKAFTYFRENWDWLWTLFVFPLIGLCWRKIQARKAQ